MTACENNVDESVECIVQSVLDSPKYRYLHPGLVARIARCEITKRRKFKPALKATRSKLHQIGGAYFTSPISGQDYNTWLNSIRAAGNDRSALEQTCRYIMSHHTSTSERLPLLGDFYPRILNNLPPIRSVIDVACGLNPLAIPWMPLEVGAQYYAYDIYSDMLDFIHQALEFMPVKGIAEARDVVADPPGYTVDLALVLKTLPCLEQLDRGAGEVLLNKLNARYLLVSFPARSLGGRSKGMPQNYRVYFEALLKDKLWRVQLFEFKSEIVFLVEKGDQHGRPD